MQLQKGLFRAVGELQFARAVNKDGGDGGFTGGLDSLFFAPVRYSFADRLRSIEILKVTGLLSGADAIMALTTSRYRSGST